MSNIPPATRLALGALVISLTVASCSRSAQSHFDRGNGYLAKGNEAAAILEFATPSGRTPGSPPRA